MHSVDKMQSSFDVKAGGMYNYHIKVSPHRENYLIFLPKYLAKESAQQPFAADVTSIRSHTSASNFTVLTSGAAIR